MAQGEPAGDDEVTATLSGVPHHAVIVVSRYSGVHAINPIGTFVTGNNKGILGSGSGGSEHLSYTLDLATTGEGSVVYAATAIGDQPHMPGTHFIEHAKIMQGSGDKGVGIAIQDQAANSTVAIRASYTRPEDWSVVGIEIKPSSLAFDENPDAITTDDAKLDIPTQYQLDQCYPNPFNPSTLIRYSLPRTTRIRLAVYDLRGQLAATLVDGVQNAGHHSYLWKAVDTEGRPLASGIYFYRLQAGSYEKSYRMLLVR